MRTLKFFLLFVITVCSIDVTSQILPGRDAYQVQTQAVTLSNGAALPASAFVVERPAPNTYIQGMVLIKTRGTYGVHRHEGSIDGSSVNELLNVISTTNVTSTYVTPANASDEDVRLASQIGLDRIYTVRYASQEDAFDVCKRMMLQPDIEYAVPVLLHQQSFIPNDPKYAQQTWMKNLKMEEAWDVTRGSANVLIAIVDSGTDWMHEDLAGKIRINKNEIANNQIDDDQNGFVDDVRGWDFVGNVSAQEAYSGVLRPDNDPRVSYPTINGTNGHGTLTAGCAAASTNNGVGVAGTGFECSILPIKVGSDNPNVGGLLGGYAGVKYAADMGAQIINCSWGGTTADPGGQDLINYCLAKGALIVAASGNDGLFTEQTPHYPSSYEGVLAVGSSSGTDRVSGFSNYGYDVTTYAPGEYILSTFPNNDYQGFPGTSFSSPLVAGICGLIKAKHPDWTPQMIIQQIRSTSDQLVGVSAADRPKYYGRTNGRNALKYNNSFSSGDRVPGIAMQSLTIGTGATQIVNYDPTNISITLINYLADAQDVKVTVQPIGTGVSINGNAQTTIPSILHGATAPLNISMQLSDTYPWYEANVQLMLTIQSGAYLNYVMVRIPVRLPSNNQHTLASGSQYVSFNLVDFTTDGVLWASGTYLGSQAVFTGTQSGASNVIAAPFAATSLCGVNTRTVLLGGLSSSKATIAITRDAKNWSSTDVSGTMSSVASIAMLDSQTGFAVGNPVGSKAGGKFGIMKTTDGGLTWAKVSSAPNANGNETVSQQAAFANAGGFWFTTSAKRVIYTRNNGTSWSSAVVPGSTMQIISIAVDDADNGALVYTENGVNKVALSEKGGAWKADAVNLTALGIKAVAVGSPGKHLVLVGAIGQVFGSDNGGKDWQTILSKDAGTTRKAVARTAGNTIVATIGDNIGVLSYRYSGPNGSKILSVTNATIDYGNLTSGQNRLRTIKVESTGESDASILSVNLVPEGSTPSDAFRIVSELSSVIPAGGSDNLGVRLYATDTGTYRATATITSNANPGGTLVVSLIGYVSPATGVEDGTIENVIALFPNPSRGNSTLVLPAAATVSVVSVTGQRVRSYGLLAAGANQISVEGLSEGMYTIVVEEGKQSITIPMVYVP